MLAAQISGAAAPALPRRIRFVPGRARGARENLGSAEAAADGGGDGGDGPHETGGPRDPGPPEAPREAHGEPPGFEALRRAGYEVHYVRTQAKNKREAREGDGKEGNEGEYEDDNETAENRADEDFARWEAKAKEDGAELFPVASDGWMPLMQWQQVAAVGPGFVNLGNTCFLNSVLQCLTYLPGLAQLALEDQDVKIDLMRVAKKARAQAEELGRLDRYCALEVLTQHMRAIHSMTRKASAAGRAKKRQTAASPDFFVRNLRKLSKHMRVGRQQDAHEFLRVLMSNMQESCALAAGLPEHSPDRRLRTTAVMRLFGGVLESKLTCGRQTCGADTRSFEPFMDLSLDVAHTRIKTIEDALRRFMANERLDQENQWTCPVCHKPSKAVKRLGIRRTPNQLVLHLKRFGFGARGRKVRKPVLFDRELNMESAIVGARPSDASASETFQLCGVVVHVGPSVTSGHYISFVRASNGLWYQMNDDVVRQVSFTVVQGQQAYLLFYSRKQAPGTPPPASGAAEVSPAQSAPKAPHGGSEDVGTAVSRNDGLASFAAAFAASAAAAKDATSQSTVRSDLFGDYLDGAEGDDADDDDDQEEKAEQGGNESNTLPEREALAEDEKPVNRSLPRYLARCYLKNPARTSRVSREVFLAYHLVPYVRESKERARARHAQASESTPTAIPGEMSVASAASSPQNETATPTAEDASAEEHVDESKSAQGSDAESVSDQDDEGLVLETRQDNLLEKRSALPPTKRPRSRRSAGDEVVTLERSAHSATHKQRRGAKDAWASAVRQRTQEVRQVQREKRKQSSYDRVDAALDRGRQKKVKGAGESKKGAGAGRGKGPKGARGNAFQRVQSEKTREYQTKQRKKEKMFEAFAKK